MLIALCTGQGAQALSALNLEHIFTSHDRASFSIAENLKTSRPGVTHAISACEFKEYTSICPLGCLNVWHSYFAPRYASMGTHSRAECAHFWGACMPSPYARL